MQVRSSDNHALIEVAEPTAAALSLFRLLLLRAGVGGDGQQLVVLAPYHLAKRTHAIVGTASKAVADSDLDARRALERLLEVATRVLELCRQDDG